MDIHSSILKLALPLLLAATLLAPLQVKADFVSSVTSASICDLRNMGNVLAQKGLIRQNGTITNILSGNNIPVFCPIITSIYATQGYDVFIRILNPSSSTRSFSCVLSQYDQFNNKTRSIKRSMNLSPLFSAGLTFYNLGVIPVNERLDLRCEVPPGGAYGALSVF